MTIRQAFLTDIPQIMKLVADVVPVMIAAGNLQWNNDYPNPAVFTKDIDNKQLWLAEVAGEIAGIIAITTSREPDHAKAGLDIEEPAIVVHRLAVSPHYRGLGIAVALLNHAEYEAMRQEIHVLRADTSTRNEATPGLFSKLGYVLAGEIDLAHKPGQKFYCYEKRLPVADRNGEYQSVEGDLSPQ